MFFEDGLHNIELYDVEVSDGAEYKCVASNIYGSEECSCKLTVRGELPPFLFNVDLIDNRM